MELILHISAEDLQWRGKIKKEEKIRMERRGCFWNFSPEPFSGIPKRIFGDAVILNGLSIYPHTSTCFPMEKTHSYIQRWCVSPYNNITSKLFEVCSGQQQRERRDREVHSTKKMKYPHCQGIFPLRSWNTSFQACCVPALLVQLVSYSKVGFHHPDSSLSSTLIIMIHRCAPNSQTDISVAAKSQYLATGQNMS